MQAHSGSVNGVVDVSGKLPSWSNAPLTALQHKSSRTMTELLRTVSALLFHSLFFCGLTKRSIVKAEHTATFLQICAHLETQHNIMCLNNAVHSCLK